VALSNRKNLQKCPMSNLPGDHLLKANDVARILGVSRTQAYRLMLTELPSVRFGGATVRVRPVDLEAYINKHLDDHDDGENNG
jgi:predicted DNA-binding transcriptional regulator AlpA